MEPGLSPGRFLLQIASESFEEGGCGLPSEEQAVEEIRTVSPTEWKNYCFHKGKLKQRMFLNHLHEFSILLQYV
jgi:hypothetical protein